MASRRSHAPHKRKQIEQELRVPRSGTYIMKPTASSEGAQLWVSDGYVSHRDTALIGVCYGRVRGGIKTNKTRRKG